MFVSVLGILLICKLLNFTKKWRHFPKFAYNFLCEKVNISVIATSNILPFIVFKEHYYVLRFCQLSVKVRFKQTVENNDYLIFLIFFVFTLVFFLEEETRDKWVVQRVHLYIWPVAGDEFAVIGTRTQGFNLRLIS